MHCQDLQDWSILILESGFKEGPVLFKLLNYGPLLCPEKSFFSVLSPLSEYTSTGSKEILIKREKKSFSSKGVEGGGVRAGSPKKCSFLYTPSKFSCVFNF